MDFQHYQKMFQQQQQLHHHQQQQNGFPSMNTYYPQPSFRHPQQHGQQHSMMNSGFNPFSGISKPMNNFNGHRNNHFMFGNQQQNTAALQFLQPTFNLPPLPSTSSLDSPTMTNSSPAQTLSNDGGSVKEETAREVFFRTLSSSLKEANKFYSGKTTTWKNPFLYKTNLCDNYCNRQYCRYGVNCWYAHGPHELRCIPEGDELPDPTFISQYLSFLGLPKQTLDQIIQYAYYVANLLTSPDSPWFGSSKKAASSELPSFDSTSSITTASPPKVVEQILPLSTAKTNPINIPSKLNKPENKFYSSLASNGGWGEIESAINGIVDDNSGTNNENVDDSVHLGKSYRLFGESFNAAAEKHW